VPFPLDKFSRSRSPRPRSLGLIGFGAFGRLAAKHLALHFTLRVFDPALDPAFLSDKVEAATLAEAAGSPIVVVAVPVSRMAHTLEAIAPHVRPGALILDVGSVKVEPVRLMRNLLPANVDIVATHPLFGPQSARNGVKDLKVAVCPVRGREARRVAAFLRSAFGLQVVPISPEGHDREAAMAQGLTHLIAKVLVQMEPLPRRITTPSFDLLVRAIGMVRDDPPSVFDAIERANPYAAEVRRRFFDLASELDLDLRKGR
jgi:prephenate dehydrogenase